MHNILFQSEPEHVSVKSNGSQAQITNGVGAFQDNPGQNNPGWFVGEQTLILGTTSESSHEQTAAQESYASWELSLDSEVSKHAEEGLLIIASERTLGGLHTDQQGATAKVFLNEHRKDFIRLEDRPLGHKDYFHLPPRFERFEDWPIPLHGTMYIWPVTREQLTQDNSQVLRVEVDSKVAWDIDHVILIVKRLRPVVRGRVVEFIYLILGALLGGLVTKLF